MSTEKQYPTMETYAVRDFYQAKHDLEKVVNDMYEIRGKCEMCCFYRGDLTGRVYGMSYVALKDAAELMADFERKVSAYKEAEAALKKELPAVDSAWHIGHGASIDYNREIMSGLYTEISEYMDLTHKNYEQYPAPSRTKNTGNNLLALVGLIAIVYSIWHTFF